MEDGKVVGLLAEDEKGNVIKVEAPVVSIGTGGYANNHEFLYGVSETKNVNIQRSVWSAAMATTSRWPSCRRRYPRWASGTQ